MLNNIKNFFIPHDGNDHQPHALRTQNIQLLLVAIFLLEIGTFALPYISNLSLNNNSFLAAVLPGVLDDLTNQNRTTDSLKPLVVSSVLNKAAELKAQDMAQKSYFAHTSPDGKTPWYWFGLVGYKYEYAGENLAVDFTDSADVAIAWMNSPEHRANILKDSYTEIGTGVATGTYQGSPTIFVAQIFAKPTSSSDDQLTIITSNHKTDNIPPTDVSISVGGSLNDISHNSQTKSEVLGASTSTSGQSNLISRYVTSPKSVLNLVLAIVVALVAVALLLKLFIRTDKRHPLLITNGLIVIAVVFGIYAVNNYIAKSKTATKTSFVSFSAQDFIQNK